MKYHSIDEHQGNHKNLVNFFQYQVSVSKLSI